MNTIAQAFLPETGIFPHPPTSRKQTRNVSQTRAYSIFYSILLLSVKTNRGFPSRNLLKSLFCV